MNTATIDVKIETKTKAQAIAKKLGISLSEVVEQYLKQFVKTKGSQITSSEEEPNAYLIQSLKQAEKDIKQGKTLKFDNGDAVLKYLRSMLTNDKSNQGKKN
ncbi:MAG: type II toxin-antitoxin system RelB/DinJ family antitoxin [Candidatus Levyibacteriota bacterium]